MTTENGETRFDRACSMGTTAAMEYLSELCWDAVPDSPLECELSGIARRLVPDFADACQIEVETSDGSVERVAKFAETASRHVSFVGEQRDAARSLTIPLNVGLTAIGSLHLGRLVCSSPFSDDERLDARELVRKIRDRVTLHQASCEQRRLPGGPRHSGSQKVSSDDRGALMRASAILAHELRNPLTAIRAAADLMDSSSTSQTRLKKALQRQVQRMSELINDLLDASRNLNGRAQFNMRPVDLKPIVKTVLQSLASTVESRRQSIATEIDPRPLWLKAEPLRVSQILTNLLSNASKYSDCEKVIRLKMHRCGEDIEIRVLDQGIGFEREELPNLFEFFSQSHSIDALDHRQGGLGIGLGLVKSLVQMHGGSVDAYSEGKGKGSEFCVRLPSCEPVTGSRNVSADAVISTQLPSLRVLVVDDQRDTRFLLAALVKKLGPHQTKSAADGWAALDLLTDFRPDVILLDLGLPEMSGLELVRRIRQREECRDTLLVALTGYDDDHLRHEAEQAGFDLYQVKPASMEMLKRTFRHPKLLDQQVPA